MLINKTGAEFQYNGMAFKIGERIIANSQSEYSGLIGHILEIRDGEDKETENETPDIYCEFDVPPLPYDEKALEKHFSELYGETKKIDEIPLDCIIMAPEMLDTMTTIQENQEKIIVYAVEEDWSVDGESGHTTSLFGDYQYAKIALCEMLQKEQNTGCIQIFRNAGSFISESDEHSYECWIDGEYIENHYCLNLIQKELLLSSGKLGEIGREYLKQCRIEDFESQLVQSDITTDLLNGISDNIDDMYSLIAGIVGSGVAVEFRTWAKVYKDLPSIEEIFDGKMPSMPKNTDAMYALTASMSCYARTHKNELSRIANSIRYADKMPPDFSAVLLKDYMHIEKDFKQTLLTIPEFSKWLQTKGGLMNGSVK